jgi:2-aminoadipate transaminase
VDELRRAADRVLQDRPELALQYGPEQGYGPLIDYVRDKLAREEGLALERPQIMLTGGSAQALDHLCTLFTRPGDVILVEAPSYSETLQLFRDHGLSLLQIPIDAGGLQVEELATRLENLARRGERARLIYTIPNFQNPSGVTLAAERRPAILELAQRFDLLVIEDDVYRDLFYGDPAPASMYALDSGQRALRIGSFSKILAPGVRLGWLMGPPALIQRLIESGYRCMGGGANPLMANVLAEYCTAGLLDAHIARLRDVYRQRRDAALAALEAHMPDGVEWTQPAGGVFVWITLPKPLQAAEVVERAHGEGLMIPAGDPFFAETPTGQYLRLAFSYVKSEKIDKGVRLLAQVVTEALQEAL